MVSKRIKSSTPNVSGGGGGATTLDVPSVRYSEDATVGDNFIASPHLAEDASVTDDFIVRPLLNDDATVDDMASLPLLLTQWAEDAQVNDLAKVVLSTVDVARSATPDSDLMFDAYGDQVLSTTNFGNANLQVKKTTPAGSSEKRAWIAIDLTNYGALTAAGTGLSLSIRASTTLLALTQNMTWTAIRTAAKPFTESTVTYNAGPGVDATVQSGTVAVSATPTVFVITITPANLQAALGQWLYIQFSVTDVADLGVDTVTITSRDQAANRPTFTINYLQRGT